MLYSHLQFEVHERRDRHGTRLGSFVFPAFLLSRTTYGHPNVSSLVLIRINTLIYPYFASVEVVNQVKSVVDIGLFKISICKQVNNA